MTLTNIGVRVGVAIVFLDKDNQVLIGKRVNTSSGSHLWGLPGGRMELWEDTKKTAVREAQEETGLIIKEEDLEYLFFTNDMFKESGEHWLTLYYKAFNWEGIVKRMEPDKCLEWKWENINKLSKKEIFCGWKEPLKKILKNEK